MALWLDLARLTAGANVVLLLALGAVWLRGYLDHGARHTLMLLVFAGFLFVENLVWLYVYVIRTDVSQWYVATSTGVQISLMSLCGLEFIALGAMASFTLR